MSSSRSFLNEADAIQYMRGAFLRQRDAFASRSAPPALPRVEKLNILRDVILLSEQDICTSLSRDFGYRPTEETVLSDMLSVLGSIKYCARNIKGWMRPSRRRAGLLLAPARVRVEYEPLGVVGIVVPWNFPLALSVGPLAYAIAAGNRVMIKMSPRTPAFNRVLDGILREVFDEDEVTMVEGDIELSRAFVSMPFNHLVFTGSTRVGREVMRSAAENLTPLTLELGGKSPVIVCDDVSMRKAVGNMIWGKTMNAGQVCVAPDYVLVPRKREREFVDEFRRAFRRMYGSAESPDMTAVVDDAHMRRIEEFIRDAIGLGAEVVDVSAAFPPGGRGMSTKLLLNVTGRMKVMREEIFGPLLPVIAYDNIENAIEFVTHLPGPLALYIMSHDKKLIRQIIDCTRSGSVGINDAVTLFVAEDAPFGGVGHSGMGMYHGKEGFLAFSNHRTIVSRGKLFNTAKLAMPPYGKLFSRLMRYIFIR